MRDKAHIKRQAEFFYYTVCYLFLWKVRVVCWSFIIFQVKLKQVSFSVLFMYLGRTISAQSYSDFTRIIFAVWMQRWIYNALWYTTSWYPWGFLHAHIIDLMKTASFWNCYITVSEPNTLNKMENNYCQWYSSRHEVFLTWLAMRKMYHPERTKYA